MTVTVKPGTAECFYLNVLANDELELEYQVINGEQGELDIDFALYSYAGNLLKSEKRLSDSFHKLTLTEAGDYRFCFDNTFSRFSSKTVFFTFMLTNIDAGLAEEWGGDAPYLNDEDIYEMKVEDIKDAVDRIRSHVTKARLVQDSISAFEARDRNVAENNYTRINTFSCVSVIVMITTGVAQVVLLRSLFDDQSKLHRLWNKDRSRF
ncbi:GOLD domain [Trinorchestia longiramus]|nr:GOLD domain [Trinorchestia longiramus]